MDKRHSFIYSFVGSFIVPFIKNTEINEIQQKMFNEINYETIHIETKKHERKSKRVCALRIDDETKLVVFGCVGVVCGWVSHCVTQLGYAGGADFRPS